MRNFQGIIWTRIYREIFKSALVYFKTSTQNFKPLKTLKIWRPWELTLNNFLTNTYLWWKFTLPVPQQILSFSSPFRPFEIKNFLRRSIMVADNILLLVAPNPSPHRFLPHICFHFYRPGSAHSVKNDVLTFRTELQKLDTEAVVRKCSSK